MTSIPIERLDTGTLIYVPDLHAKGVSTFETVMAVDEEFEEFFVWIETDGWRKEIGFSVPYGGRVEFGGVGTPQLLPIESCTPESVRARIEADNASTVSMISEANAKCADMRGEAETDGRWVAA